MNAALFDQLCQHVGAAGKLRGRNFDMQCPNCGKDRRHFGFSTKGANCFACGYKVSLPALAERLGLSAREYRAIEPARQERPEIPRRWQTAPERYIEQYCAALDRVTLWREYKPLTLESISQWRLGVGVLPSSQCKHRRLIVPVMQDGQVVAIRGRAIDCDCPKWLAAGGSKSVLFGLESVQAGDVVWWVENNIDAILAAQQLGYKGVSSTTGAGSWQRFIEPLVRRQPSLVVVALDNDLAGQPNAETYRELVAEWRKRMPVNAKAPVPNGPLIAKSLRALGVPVKLWQWPAGTEPKADIGSILGVEGKVAA